MKQRYRFNRQKLDYLLTDLLPYEKGNHYTHRYFYEYLSKENKLKGLFRKTEKEGLDINGGWYSKPLHFTISKNKDSFRELSFINPLGLLESLLFINIFEKDILNIMHNKQDFSLRKPYRTNQLAYKKKNRQTVFYRDQSTKNQLLLSLESSGSYFNHVPFKSITSFKNDRRFYHALDKYEFFLSIDIQNCFPSIYTHSYKWLILNKSYDSMNFKKSKSVYRYIDSYLQSINGAKTNGIVVGPEISRLLVEFMFVHLDQQIIETLAIENIQYNKDYKVYRFVDDYFIHSKNKKIQDAVYNTISEVLNDYQLKINDMKIIEQNKESVLSQWIIELLPVMQLLENIFEVEPTGLINLIQEMIFDDAPPNKDIQLEIRKLASDLKVMNNKKIKYINLRSKTLKAVKESNESILIPSYLLTVILKQIEENSSNNKKFNMEINELVVYVCYLYSLNVNYSATQKVIRIFSLLIDEYELDISDEIEKSIDRFKVLIFTQHSNDWIDLLLFFSSYQIEISHGLVNHLIDEIIKEENPVKLAALCMFLEYGYINKNEEVDRINKIIDYNVKRINWENFFKDDKSWWVFIFLSYPELEENVKENMISKLRQVESNLRGHIVAEAKRIVINFLLNNEKHFIEWNFTKEDYYKKYYFYTKDRTVFNPDIITQRTISR